MLSEEQISGDTLVEVLPTPLDQAKYNAFVTDPRAGAIATFIGITRNSFQGKEVLYLEYEAYKPMALNHLEVICKSARERWKITKAAIAHRTGRVGVSEASVIIAMSSPHRQEALQATQWAIDELKATVPIWKLEFFKDGSMWKENAESRRLWGQRVSEPA